MKPIFNKSIMILCILTLVLAPIVKVNAATNYQGIAYNSVTLTQIGQMSDISVEKNNDSIMLSFTLNQKDYSIKADYLESSENQQKYYFYDNDSEQCINVIVYDGNITGRISQKKESPINRIQKGNENFSFTISNISNTQNLTNALKQVTTENESQISESIMNIKAPTKASKNSVMAANSSLHVLASGLSVPFLITSGVSEGWASTTYLYSNYYSVNNLQYSISYNWPSDGISLWYDYINSDVAYQTPAWPNAGLTSVSGSWRIDSSIGKFVAEATVSVLAKGVPIMYTVYDTTNIY